MAHEGWIWEPHKGDDPWEQEGDGWDTIGAWIDEATNWPTATISVDISNQNISDKIDYLFKPPGGGAPMSLSSELTNSGHDTPVLKSMAAYTATIKKKEAEQREMDSMGGLFPGLFTIDYLDDCPVAGCSHSRRMWETEASLRPHAGLRCTCGDCLEDFKKEVRQGIEKLSRYSSLGGSRFSIMNWVVHLNDSHKWARTETDNQRLQPNLNSAWERHTIYDWLKEGVEKYGWDLVATVEE